MLNNVSLIGRLVRDPDLRFSPNGKAVANFTLAVGRPFANQNNEYEVDYINCVIWGKPAENLAEYQRKGNLIGVEGRLQTRSYQTNQGDRRYVTEVIASSVYFLSPVKKNNQKQNNQPNQQPYNQHNQQNSFPPNQPNGFPPNQQQGHQHFNQNGFQNQNQFPPQQRNEFQNYQNDVDFPPFDVSDDDFPV